MNLNGCIVFKWSRFKLAPFLLAHPVVEKRALCWGVYSGYGCQGPLRQWPSRKSGTQLDWPMQALTLTVEVSNLFFKITQTNLVVGIFCIENINTLRRKSLAHALSKRPFGEIVENRVDDLKITSHYFLQRVLLLHVRRVRRN